MKPPTLNKGVAFRINEKAGYSPAFLCPSFLAATLHDHL
ncbi:hypothetical protein BN2364_1664 [Alloalcanivorax xenomutans]|nr:hypothetical protein BN2364_1664 [Alloalcanivorax xenomutans]